MTTPSASASRSERGAATLMAVAVAGVLLMLGMAGTLVVSAAAAHRTAQSAADLAALAGAQAWQEQGDVAAACAEALAVADANHAVLLTCDLAGDDLLAVVRVDGPSMFGHEFEIVGRARAGPEDADRSSALPVTCRRAADVSRSPCRCRHEGGSDEVGHCGTDVKL